MHLLIILWQVIHMFAKNIDGGLYETVRNWKARSHFSDQWV